MRRLPTFDGASCDDGRSCTTGDQCTDGTCDGAPVANGMSCSDTNTCTMADLCGGGACVGTALANGTSCDDADVCTGNDECTAGVCGGDPLCGPTIDYLIPGRIAIVKGGTLAKFVAKPPFGTFTLPTADPMAVGGTLRWFDTASSAGDDTYNLAASLWKGLGNPAGSKGYKFCGLGDPCKVVLVEETVIKAICKGAGVTLTPPFSGTMGIVLRIGTGERYCAAFSGQTVKNDATLTKRKNAFPPGGCP